jgi:hypothetical protein
MMDCLPLEGVNTGPEYVLGHKDIFPLDGAIRNHVLVNVLEEVTGGGIPQHLLELVS